MHELFKLPWLILNYFQSCAPWNSFVAGFLVIWYKLSQLGRGPLDWGIVSVGLSSAALLDWWPMEEGLSLDRWLCLNEQAVGNQPASIFIHVSCLFCLSFCPHFPQWWIFSPYCFWSWYLWQEKYLLCMHKALILKPQTSPKGLWVWWSVYDHVSKNQWPAWDPESMLASQTSQTNKF